MKQCKLCNEFRSLDMFSSDARQKDGKSNRCASCKEAKYSATYHKDIALRSRFEGFSIEAFQALVSKQGGLCAICKQPETQVDYRTNKIKALTVDHCHKTGKVRGLLCSAHNRAIGLLNDDPSLLREAATYLEATQVVEPKPIVYFLAGQSGSGKTWIAGQLKGKFDVAAHDTHTYAELEDHVDKANTAVKPVLFESGVRVSTFINKNAHRWDIRPVFILETEQIIAARILGRGGSRLKGIPKRNKRMQAIARLYNSVFTGTSDEVLAFLKAL